MTNAPTAHYQQHHDVEEPRVDRIRFQQAWRVRTRLDGLLADRAITLRQWHAGVAFRDDMEAAAAAAWRTPLLLHVAAKGAKPGGTLAYRLDALQRLRRVADALGPFAFDLLEASVVRDWPWAYLGRRLEVDPKTARAWTIVAIRALSLL